MSTKKTTSHTHKTPAGTMLPFFILIALNGTFIDKKGDTRHPQTSLEICDWLRNNYPEIATPGRTTVDRCLENMQDSIIFDENARRPLGLFLNCKETLNANSTMTKNYCLESELSLDQIVMILDAIEAYAYIDNKDTKSMLGFFEKIYPVPNRIKPSSDNPQKSDRSGMSNNFLPDILMDCKKIIDNGHFAFVTNGSYGIINGQIELLPRRDKGQIIKPLDLLWNNGHYYLIGYMKAGQKAAHLRLDRIIDISEVTNPEKHKEYLSYFETNPPYDPKSYQATHPAMFGGKMCHAEMLCHISPTNGIMNALIDTFGFHMENGYPKIPSASELIKLLGQNADKILSTMPDCVQSPDSNDVWIKVKYTATEMGTLLFATEYAANCKVLSPAPLYNKVRENLNSAHLLNS